MDIYRFFHPHHNPRLHSTPVRQQELSELEQVASELRKALERTRKRTERSDKGRILPSHYEDILKAIRFVEASLETLCDAHEGDSPEDLVDLLAERSQLIGWEAWSSILREQILSDGDFTRPETEEDNGESLPAERLKVALS